ncbi:1-acyl-sn-glycerol-3-phosphate acyltransferase [Filimonas lacunae]|uniref:1-acyl-sn-glycerol-3-phosphate acyltransferase n=1 Tax=Filimonas lacunae TaxID=477680 RepID=A0A173MDN2_9BACT|nr:lysophospholipid acyltransferase family protein [Filimonas lacunae]BAV05589.1 1-acyl-sn-glycerol-3-phosphate acyltransferase [Filimonas lacunae]SIT29276.1 1-acyl-sn-glycerol-3-phosphate acyltransferase [Filimonas lacunae]
MRRFLQYIYSVWALLWFVLLMIVVLPLVLLTALLGKQRGGPVVYFLCRWWGRLWYIITGIRHKEVYEAPHDKKRQHIFVANHSSYMDIPCAVRCIHQPMRVLGKAEMVKYPVFGIIYRMAVILVDRSSAKRRAESMLHLKAAVHSGISVFIFPEGTFNETPHPLKNFFDGAFRIAIETQTPIKPILFVDAIDRLHYRGLLELTPGKNRTVFLEEVDVTGLTMADVSMLRNKVHGIMDAGMRRYRHYKDVSTQQAT